MRLFAQALRAVVVELMGVLLVVWLLFNAATWTVDSYHPHSAAPRQTVTVPALAKFKEVGRRWLAHRSTAESKNDVARLLDHYSSLYGNAAIEHFKRVTKNPG